MPTNLPTRDQIARRNLEQDYAAAYDSWLVEVGAWVMALTFLGAIGYGFWWLFS